MPALGQEEKFLKYYHRELGYLRNAGRLFAHQHPKIARRLDIGEGESPDPHLERLLESFAFMTARLNREIDDRLPQISSAILAALYPNLVNPIPAMGIAHFQVDATKGKMTTGYEIPKGTSLFSYAEEGTTCNFRTGYPLTLWPIDLIDADFIQATAYSFKYHQPKASWYLKLKFEIQDDLDPADLAEKGLTVHLTGGRANSFALYEGLFAQMNPQLALVGENNELDLLPDDSLQVMGLGVDEEILPKSPGAHPAYQLLQEYFHFPEKFLFFNIKNIKIPEGATEFEVLISLGDAQIVDRVSVSRQNFMLGCVPIINLFPKVSDPLRIDHKRFEYRLVPDERRERTTEIHSIQKVTVVEDGQTDPHDLAPYFSYRHEDFKNDREFFWLSRRQPSLREGVPGSDVYLSFVDMDFNPSLPEHQTVYAHTMCTNRFLPDQLPGGTVLEIEDRAPISNLILLDRPVSQVYTPNDGETLWKLISHLSVNHLSITDREVAFKALKETLRLYAGQESHRFKEIDAIVDLSHEMITRRMGDEAWRGYVRGIGLTLTIDEQLQSGASSFLLAYVLQRYFALQVSINSFVELTLKSTKRQDVWMRWRPLSGEQHLL